MAYNMAYPPTIIYQTQINNYYNTTYDQSQNVTNVIVGNGQEVIVETDSSDVKVEAIAPEGAPVGILKIANNEEKKVSNWTSIKDWFKEHKKGIFIGLLIAGIAITTIGLGLYIGGATLGSLQIGVFNGCNIVTFTTTHGFIQFAGLFTTIPGFGLVGFSSGSLSQID